eukprot:PITA_29829
MHSDEILASYFLHIDEVFNCMKNLGEEIKEFTLVEKVLRSLSTKFESKVSAIEEKHDLQNITMMQLHGILSTFEMRKGGPLDMREFALKSSTKGKEEHNESGHILEEEDEVNFVKKLQRGYGRFRGKLPFKCFSYGRFNHYAARCPHKDKFEKGKEYAKGNRKQVVNKRSYYREEDSDVLSNSDEDEIGQDYILLMAYDNGNFWEALEERQFRQTSQKEKTPLNPKIWRRKESQLERCGIALYAEGQENEWYINSGCSKHMTGDKEKLHSYNALEKEKNVSFGNYTPAIIKGKGSIFLNEKIKAGNVMYVDGLKHNLLSVSQMCDQGNEKVFRSNRCVVCELDIGETMIKGTRTPNNLYILKGGQEQCYLRKSDENRLWHRRLGHLSFSQIRKACRFKVVRDLLDINIPESTICKPCQIGKKTRVQFMEK